MGFWRDEWNKLEEKEKKRFISTFKPLIYGVILLVFSFFYINYLSNIVKDTLGL